MNIKNTYLLISTISPLVFSAIPAVTVCKRKILKSVTLEALKSDCMVKQLRVVGYESLKTKENFRWVIPKMVAVTFQSFSLQNLSHSLNEVSQRWSVVTRVAHLGE